MKRLNLTSASKSQRRQLIKELKILWAVYYMINVSDSAQDIAEAIDVSLEKLEHFISTPQWQEALVFWGFPTTIPTRQQRQR